MNFCFSFPSDGRIRTNLSISRHNLPSRLKHPAISLLPGKLNVVWGGYRAAGETTGQPKTEWSNNLSTLKNRLLTPSSFHIVNRSNPKVWSRKGLQWNSQKPRRFYLRWKTILNRVGEIPEPKIGNNKLIFPIAWRYWRNEYSAPPLFISVWCGNECYHWIRQVNCDAHRLSVRVVLSGQHG